MPELAEHFTAGGGFAAGVNRGGFCPPFGSVAPQNRIESEVPFTLTQYQNTGTPCHVVAVKWLRIIRYGFPLYTECLQVFIPAAGLPKPATHNAFLSYPVIKRVWPKKTIFHYAVSGYQLTFFTRSGRIKTLS